MKKKTIEHPAFGSINISRVSIGGKGYRLFNSPLKHHHVIEIKISGAGLQRSLSKDWIFPREGKISVWLSEAQFGRFISSAGIGDGIPCTITRFNGESIEEVPHDEGVKKTFDKELREATSSASSGIAEAEKMIVDFLGKPRVTKKELNELKDVIYKLRMDIGDTIPFIENQFEKATDAAVQDDKNRN